MSEPGEIPQSIALAEAGADSLSESLGRDPEKYGAQDRPKIIAALRKQRERYAEALKTKPQRESKPRTVTLQSSASAKDLDL